MISFLSRMIEAHQRKTEAAKRPPRRRLAFAEDPPVIYAIGDVHGCLPLLRDIERQIAADAAAFEGEKWIVMLGDYVDRGPRSAQVLDHLLEPGPQGFQRLCLAGNHEAAMLAFLDDPAGNSQWLDFGGVETLASYGMLAPAINRGQLGSRSFRNMIASHVPVEHVTLLADLPSMIETPRYVFVHAGLRPGVKLSDQDEQDLLCSTDRFAESFSEFGKTVVHGHQSRASALVATHRIALDTAAYASGCLTAVRLAQEGADHKIFTTMGGP